MDLEDPLCQVDPNDRNLLHGCLLRCGWSCNITSLAHFDPVGRGHPPHQNPPPVSIQSESFARCKISRTSHSAKTGFDRSQSLDGRRLLMLTRGSISYPACSSHRTTAELVSRTCRLILMQPSAARRLSASESSACPTLL